MITPQLRDCHLTLFISPSLYTVTMDNRHHLVLLTRIPEQLAENQRKVTKCIIKINSRGKITRFTQFDKRYNKQGNMIEALEE